MKSRAQAVKGRIEEAAGALSGDDELRAGGRTDQAVRHVNQAAEGGVRQVEESARKIAAKTGTASAPLSEKASNLPAATSSGGSPDTTRSTPGNCWTTSTCWGGR